jgi:four helix bundle protein
LFIVKFIVGALMRHQFAFEKLDVWQLAKKLVAEIYKITNSYPSQEKFGIISQINRAAISVSANIAEGSARVGGNAQSRFYIVAYSSLLELASHLLISIEIGLLKQEDYDKIDKLILEISNKLNALYKSQKFSTKQLNN